MTKALKYLSLIVALHFPLFAAFTQSIGSISGYIVDLKTDEPLIGASVKLNGTNTGAVTDVNGFYQISDIVTKTYNVTASYVGYDQLTKYNVVVRSTGNPILNFELSETSESLEEVVIVANPFQKLSETPLSIQRLSAEEIATYPGGNNDIAKVVQSLPGVSGSVGGFRNDVIIRGGAPNENVYYLDGVEIPNINHFSTQGSAGGPVGLLNVSFIDEVTLSTSAFGAKYDNVLSGVLQFDQRTGNRREFQGNLRVSASETALTAEGPLFKGEKEASNTSYIVSVRRSYLQLLFKLIGLPILPDYWDYQYKLTHKLDEYNELNFIGIGAIDNFSVAAPDDFDAEQQATLDQVPIINQWNATAGVSWKRRFRDGSGFMTTTLSTNILNNNFYRYEDNEEETGLFFKNDSRETEQKLRYEQTRFLGKWTLAGGLSFQRAIYKNNTINKIDNIDYLSEIDFFKYGFFIQSSRKFFNDKLSFALGARTDANTFTLQSGQLLKTFSPRLALSYALDAFRKWKINATVGRYYKILPYTMLGFRNNDGQYINKNAKYIRSDHLVTGVEYLFSPSSRFTLEGFYKRYDHYPVSVLDSVSLANKGGGFEVLGNEAVSSVGKGRAYGLEFLFQQKFTKNFYAIFAYTLFKSEFTGFNDKYVPSVWDSRHLVTFTGGYKFKNNWEVSLRNRFVGNTPYVPVDKKETLKNYPAIISDYDLLGKYKLDLFNQLDIRIDKKWNFRKLSFSAYIEIQNALAQQTPAPPSYGLDRNAMGEINQPRKLVEIAPENGSILPILGFVVDF